MPFSKQELEPNVKVQINSICLLLLVYHTHDDYRSNNLQAAIIISLYLMTFRI